MHLEKFWSQYSRTHLKTRNCVTLEWRKLRLLNDEAYFCSAHIRRNPPVNDSRDCLFRRIRVYMDILLISFAK